MRGLGSQRGLTLLEVITAVVILGLIGTLSYGSLVTTWRAQDETKTTQEMYSGVRVALLRIKRELSMAFVSLHQFEDKRTQTLFDGESDSLIFNTSAHEPWVRNAHQSDQLEVEYRIDEVDDQRGLVRRVKYHIDDRPGRGGYEELVAPGVTELSFEYYDKSDEDWTDEWEVLIEDAEEKRLDLKMVRELVEKVKEGVNPAVETDDLATNARAVAGEMAADQAGDEATMELMEGLFLPNRVRIRLTFKPEEDEDLEYTLETQAEIHMTEPLWY